MFVVMLLPTGQDTHDGGLENGDQNRSFCARYPKTCDASGELLEAFKLKLAYGITMTRRALEGQPEGVTYQAPKTGEFRQAPPKLDGRYDVGANPQRQPPLPEHPQVLSSEERSTEWRPSRD
jgi:hypothetical protein